MAFRRWRVDGRIDEFEDQRPQLRPEAEAADGAEAGPERCQVAVRFQLGQEFWRRTAEGWRRAAMAMSVYVAGAVSEQNRYRQKRRQR